MCRKGTEGIGDPGSGELSIPDFPVPWRLRGGVFFLSRMIRTARKMLAERKLFHTLVCYNAFTWCIDFNMFAVWKKEDYQFEGTALYEFPVCWFSQLTFWKAVLYFYK